MLETPEVARNDEERVDQFHQEGGPRGAGVVVAGVDRHHHRVGLEPGDGGSGDLRLRVAVAGRDYHSRRLRQLTGIEAGEGQSAILLNDVTAWAGMGWAGEWDSKEGASGRVLTRSDGARCLGLNGAEIVFNPSATGAGLSQYLWELEQPAHAVANGYYMGCINRVGNQRLYPFQTHPFGQLLVDTAGGRVPGSVWAENMNTSGQQIQ